MGAALGSEIGQRTAEDATPNLARYATVRGMILQAGPDVVGDGAMWTRPRRAVLARLAA